MADLTPAQDLFYRIFRCPKCGGERVQNFGGSKARNPMLAEKPCFCDPAAGVRVDRGLESMDPLRARELAARGVGASDLGACDAAQQGDKQ